MSGPVKPVQHRLMIPLAFVMLVLVGGFIYLLISEQQKVLDVRSQENISGVSYDLEQFLEIEAEKMSLMQSILLNNENLNNELKDHDIDGLINDYQPIFEQLRDNYGVTHFYFLDSDRVNLIRLHNPEKRGDLINRYTTLEAERTGEKAWGLELGILGTLTLRVVQPIFEGEILIGYLELGKEIENILSNISANHDVELAVSINKSLLTRQNWETGMQFLGREGNWDLFPDNVIIFSTIGPSPTNIGNVLRIKNDVHSTNSSAERFDDVAYQIVHIPLFDVSGSEIGDLLILNDISRMKSDFLRVILLTVGTALVLLVGLLVFVFFLLRRTDKGILNQQIVLHESQSKYQGLFESSVTPIFLLDTSTRILDCNQAGLDLLGYNKDELLNMTLPLFESDTSPNQAFIDVLLADSKVDNFEQRLRRKDGIIVEVLSNSRVLVNSEGSIDRFQCTMIDITERKKSEQEIIESREKIAANENYLKNIINNIGDPLFVKDAESRLLVVNEAFCTIFGMERSDIIGKTLAEDVTPEERESFLKIDKQVLQDGQENINEETLTVRDSETQIVSTRKTRFVNDKGEKFLIGVIRDITESKKAEEEIAKSNALLEMLLDIITHDLRNPAGVIYALSDAALKETPENKIVTNIYTTSERLIEVLEHTTTLSKAAFGEKIPKDSLSLNSLIQEASDEFAASLRTAKMKFEVAIAPDTVIYANPLIKEVFKNYIGNAIKYAHDGGKIIIESESSEGAVRVCVKDFGKTITAVDRDQVFNRRVRLEHAKEEGRGLGLSIVKRIAEAHNGEVWVEPNEPRGNSFCLRIPDKMD